MNTISFVKDTVWVHSYDTVYSTLKDTLVIYDVPPELLNTYTDILKSTNEQLGLWHNPYGILITALAVLFTLLTIIAVIIIWTQGNEFKKLVSNTVNKYEGILKSFIEQKKKDLENISKGFDKAIEDNISQLKKASKDQKEEIEKRIEELKTQKEAIKQDIQSSIVYPFNIGSQTGPGIYSNQKLHKCSSCGFGFLVSYPLSGYPDYGISTGAYTTTPFGLKGVECPKCGNIDQV
ncbi:MAG: hypothetical protein KAT40_01175 [Bacteroidales bacterium]|nr:hypothetical protein [Bacteroidales bacterium]